MNGQFPMMAAAENKYLEIMKILGQKLELTEGRTM